MSHYMYIIAQKLLRILFWLDEPRKDLDRRQHA